MQNSAARKLETVEGYKIPAAPTRVISLRPSVWERVRAWAKRTLTEEKIAAPAIVTATLFLWGLFFFWFYQAMQNYTILP